MAMSKTKEERELSAEERRAVRERLEQIAERNGGSLTPDEVVKDARNKTSPLNRYFTWDVKRAAMERWIDQARRLIVRVEYRVTIEHVEYRVPLAVRDPDMAPTQQGYRLTRDVRTDPDLAHGVMTDELRKLNGIIERVRSLSIVLNVQEAVDEIAKQIKALQRRIEFPESRAAQ